jgi:hypothetical protein
VNVYFKLKRAVKRWLLRTLQPCREMVELMSESRERLLTPTEFLKLRLHLLVCAWCARYLKQIEFLSCVLREQPTEDSEFKVTMPAEARERIAQRLKNL